MTDSNFKSSKKWMDGKQRCEWCDPKDREYIRYHDEEWGIPVHNDMKLFEMLILELFQSGLSWACILHKREAFRHAFSGFDPQIVSCYGEQDVKRLSCNRFIIRHPGKINATVHNAKVFREIQRKYGSFDSYIWQWTDGKILLESGKSRSELSDKIAGDLKRKGMKYLGSTTVYAYLQAVGIINGHEENCFKCKKTYHKRNKIDKTE